MFEILDSLIKFYNPFMDLYLFSTQFINGWFGLIIFVLASATALFFIFKKNKIVFSILLVPIIYGYLGIFSLTYFSLNYNPYEIDIPTNLKQEVIGSWCKENNKITLNDDNTIKLNIDNNEFNGIWSLKKSLIIINTDNSTYTKARIVKFGQAHYLSLTETTDGLSGYQVLEYSNCN